MGGCPGCMYRYGGYGDVVRYTVLSPGIPYTPPSTPGESNIRVTGIHIPLGTVPYMVVFPREGGGYSACKVTTPDTDTPGVRIQPLTPAGYPPRGEGCLWE